MRWPCLFDHSLGLVRGKGAVRCRLLVLQRHVRQLSMAQVIIFRELKSFLRISIRTWLMDQNPCETSHFLAIGVLTQHWSISAIRKQGSALTMSHQRPSVGTCVSRCECAKGIEPVARRTAGLHQFIA